MFAKSSLALLRTSQWKCSVIICGISEWMDGWMTIPLTSTLRLPSDSPYNLIPFSSAKSCTEFYQPLLLLDFCWAPPQQQADVESPQILAPCPISACPSLIALTNQSCLPVDCVPNSFYAMAGLWTKSRSPHCWCFPSSLQVTRGPDLRE